MKAQGCAAAAILLLLLAVGCGSGGDDVDAGEAAGQAAQPETVTASAAPDVGEDTAEILSGTAIHPTELRRVSGLDPDEAIERYREECSAGDASQRCRALRRRVEYLFLDALLSLRRAGQKLDPQLYRVAARAENPQLAIVGLRGLLLVSESIPAEDQQLILAALDSPYRGVRNTVTQLGAGRIPRVDELWPRIVHDYDADSGIAYLDPTRSPEPDPAVIGSYPGARHRYFASDATRNWFTTQDPPETVIAYLARDGRQALTAEELKQKTESEAQQAYMAAALSGDARKIEEAMRQMTAKASIDWPSTLGDIGGTGEIRYIALAPDHVIAVFADDILHATSIVAPELPSVPELPALFDSENAIAELEERARREELARQILGR